MDSEIVIPFLVVVRSRGKRHVGLTYKRSLKIGSDESADIVINHAGLYDRPQTLGTGSTPLMTNGEKKGGWNCFPSVLWQMDGISVCVIELRNFLTAIFIACFLIVFFIAFLQNHNTTSVHQDWTAIQLPSEGVYGFCRQDRNHGEGARFRFEAGAFEAHRLFFIAGGKGDGTEIAFFLNGAPVGDPLILPEGWGEERSIQLPAANIRDGQNIVEIRPRIKTPEKSGWGISQVRVAPVTHPGSSNPEEWANETELILAAIQKRNMSGKELARYYEKVCSWEPSIPAVDALHNREKLLKLIEGQMRDRLQHTAFALRSLGIQGDHSSVKKILAETRAWIPKSWREGWEIYDDLSSKNQGEP